MGQGRGGGGLTRIQTEHTTVGWTGPTLMSWKKTRYPSRRPANLHAWSRGREACL